MTRYARFAWLTLAFNLAVILWGAIVRATGSGAGCGSHWPLCNGEVVPRAAAIATRIEFVHRATSGLALLAVVALLAGALRLHAKGHPARTWAWLSMLFILTEAAVGAGLVLFELVADNQSMARALFMGTHLVNTFLLLAALALTAYFASGGAPVRVEAHGSTRGSLALSLLGLILVGSSGAVAALGDTLFPAASLQRALEQDLSPTAHALIRLRLWHPVLSVTIGAAVLTFAWSLGRETSDAAVRRYSRAVVALVVAQLAAGGLNVLLLAPVPMQIVHLLLADLVWIALVLLAASVLGASDTVAGAEPTRR